MCLSLQMHGALLPVGPSGGIAGSEVHASPFHRCCQMTGPKCGASFHSHLGLGVPPLPHILDNIAGVQCFSNLIGEKWYSIVRLGMAV